MILPLGAFPVLHDLPRSRLSYIDVGHALIVQTLNLDRSHDAPFRKRESARGGSLPRPTVFAAKMKAPRLGRLSPPSAVASARRWDWSEAAFARPVRHSISCKQNLDVLNDWTDYLLRAPGGAPDGQRNCNYGVVRQETGAG